MQLVVYKFVSETGNSNNGAICKMALAFGKLREGFHITSFTLALTRKRARLNKYIYIYISLY